MATDTHRPRIGDWEPSEAETEAIQRAYIEAFRYVLDHYYDIRDDRIRGMLSRALSKADLVMVADRYLYETIRMWGNNVTQRDLPDPPDGWDEVDSDEVTADLRTVLQWRDQVERPAREGEPIDSVLLEEARQLLRELEVDGGSS